MAASQFHHMRPQLWRWKGKVISSLLQWRVWSLQLLQRELQRNSYWLAQLLIRFEICCIILDLKIGLNRTTSPQQQEQNLPSLLEMQLCEEFWDMLVINLILLNCSLQLLCTSNCILGFWSTYQVGLLLQCGIHMWAEMNVYLKWTSFYDGGGSLVLRFMIKSLRFDFWCHLASYDNQSFVIDLESDLAMSQVLALDKRLFDPRRTPTPTPAEQEEGILPLTDSIPINPQVFTRYLICKFGIGSMALHCVLGFL